MINKFLDTAIKISNEIHKRGLFDLKGSAFHYPSYIKKLSYDKHLHNHRIKQFKLETEMYNLQIFLNLNKEYEYYLIILNNCRRKVGIFDSSIMIKL